MAAASLKLHLEADNAILPLSLAAWNLGLAFMLNQAKKIKKLQYFRVWPLHLLFPKIDRL